MRATAKQQKFLESDEVIVIRLALEGMVSDASYNTEAKYTVNPANSLSFVDKHLTYLCAHPKLNPQHYLSNLRLMTRIK